MMQPRLRTAPDRSGRPIEPLEQRTLLSKAVSGVFDVAKVPVYVPANENLADVQNGPLANTGTHLASLYLDYRRAAKNGKTVAIDTPQYSYLYTDGQTVGVTLRTRGDLRSFGHDLADKYGFQSIATNPRYSAIQGLLPISALREVAGRQDVAQIAPILRPYKHTKGIANNQADAGIKADLARTNFSVDGTGVKVGVVSDSANRVGNGLGDSQRTGDLPNNVQLLKDAAGTDEGRAMLEEIYDLAPGAALAFATGDNGQQNMADSIGVLKNNGANIIVDDLGYPDEPMFQPGVIDAAIDTFVAAGGIYTEAIGNNGNSGFEQSNAQYSTTNGRTFIDFDQTNAVSTTMTVTIVDGGAVTLEWDNPYNGISGSATANLNIRFLQGGVPKFQSTDNNLATGNPVDFISFVAPGTYQVQIELIAKNAGTQNPRAFKFVGDIGLTTAQFTGTRAGGFGHAVSNSGISVGAVNFFDAPPVSTANPTRNVDYSATGPGTYFFDAAGNRLAQRITTQKPDISSIDGVNTSFFGDDDTHDTDSLPNFFGTSAAAPNVAAALALMKQADPSLTQAQALAAFKATARPLNGTAQGVWDAKGGFGLIDVNAALPQLTEAPTVDIINVKPDPHTTAVSSIQIVFTQPVSGFNRADLTLTRDGGANLLTFAQQLTSTDEVTYTLSNLSGITAINGVYKLVLNAAGAGIANLLGKPLVNGATETWTKIPPPPIPLTPDNFSANSFSSTSILLNWTDTNTAEDEYTIQRATDSAFTMNRKNIHVPADTTSFLVEGLRPGTRYFFRVRAANSSGVSPYAPAQSALTTQSGEVVLDNDSTVGVDVRGFWGVATNGRGQLNSTYLQDGNSAKGTKSVIYRPPLSGDGRYYIYARWVRASNRATNAPFDIFYGPRGELRQTIRIDQRHRGGGDGWNLVGGPFLMNRNTDAGVRIRNSGTNGYVIADAIRFLPAGPINTGRPAVPRALTRAVQTDTENPDQKDPNADLLGSGDAPLV